MSEFDRKSVTPLVVSKPKKADAVQGWLCSPDKPGIYLQQVGNDLVAKVVRQVDIDSRFFDQCGLWYRLDVPLP
jgi:hypothetical protein